MNYRNQVESSGMWFFLKKAILRDRLSIAGSQTEVLSHRSLLCYRLRHATSTSTYMGWISYLGVIKGGTISICGTQVENPCYKVEAA